MDRNHPGQAGPSPEALARNLAQLTARGQKMIADFVNGQQGANAPPPEGGGLDGLRPIASAFLELTAQALKNPNFLLEAQRNLWSSYFELWRHAGMRLLGEKPPPVTEPARGDKRFRAPVWSESLLFDFIKQSYLLTANWLLRTVKQVEGVDPQTAAKVEFYTRQFADAIAPSNFVLSNPEILRATIESNGENLLRGLENLLADLQRGKGKLSVSMTDMDAFEVGRNIAVTPGKVVFQNELMQLLQYAPSTKTVYKRPLLIFPPWINKFYILDLTAEKSFIRWAVGEGFTVFVVSWVNPDSKLADKTFESYLFEGVYAALDAVEAATGEREVNAIGYCIGGTLLSCALAHMAAKRDNRIKSATFFAAQVDFSEAGELKVFIDDEQINALEKKMDAAGGFLESSDMASTFNMLRSNDLIWSFVINNYLLGKPPAPFDLLYWNADQTNMPKQMHLFYLRECYLNNTLSKGEMVLGGERLDLGKIKIPVYLQSSRDDHIAPYHSVYKGVRLYGGEARFIVAGSGHIAGVINPPAANKYQYWTNTEQPPDAGSWLAGATEHPGSWWPDWLKWVSAKSGKKAAARIPGDGKLPVIEDAPGGYVKVRNP